MMDTPPNKLRVGFVNPTDKEVFSAKSNEGHEILARRICTEKCLPWNEYEYLSAVDYLLEDQGYIKVANYGSPHNYVALIKGSSKEAINIASGIALSLGIALILY